MKLEIEILVKFAFSDLESKEMEKIELQLQQDDYEFESSMLDIILDKAIETGYDQKEMLNWIQKENERKQEFIKNLIPNIKAPLTIDITYPIDKLIKWFNQNLFETHPALAVMRNHETQKIDLSVQYQENEERLNIKLNSNIDKQMLLIVKDTLDKTILTENITNTTSINVSDLEWHPGVYLWILINREYGRYHGYFEVQAELNPNS